MFMSSEHSANERVPERIASLEGLRRPSGAIAEAQHDTRRPAESRATMHDDSLCLRPLVDEPRDSFRVLGAEDDVVRRCRAQLVQERQPQHGRELAREGSLGQIGIRDRDADLDPFGLIGFGPAAAQDEKLRCQGA